MKIYFDNVDLSSRTGPSTFGRRLAIAAYNNGHVISDRSDRYDVMLSFIEPTHENRPGSKLIQRLDGIWFKPGDFVQRNIGIKRCYERADLVIFQSQFDKNMITHHWGFPSRNAVIHNGAEQDPIKDTSKIGAGLLQLRTKYDKVFVSSANWHPQKRLSQNIAAFKHIQTNIYPSSCLIVLGSNPDMVSDPNIFYTNNVPHEVCDQVYSISNWMLHLAWLDHCPNTVVESITQGTKIICSESGGTKELVGCFGLVLKEKEPYNYELVDYDNPPDIDVTQITLELLEKQAGAHLDVDINNVLKKYISEIEATL